DYYCQSFDRGLNNWQF
nr:immunoglobulin light chain junction region [Macaca mulatta]MOW06919.1 immunoglobulin light chain junction region [Macaca mulatta]MOW07411.1 immunoglobulin light chain junction region [Macaca mulatta]